MIRRRKSNLPKWRYEFDCRKCDNIREVHDPGKRRDGDYCIPCIERMDSRRPSPIHADEKRARPPLRVLYAYHGGRGGRKMNFPKLYECDPQKNTECNKRNCGNPCMHTTRKEFAREPSERMSIERAFEILDPTHRERYESLEPVNEACRMGRAALFLQMKESPYPDGDAGVLACPNCGSGEYLHNEDGNRNRFCGQCGKAIAWNEEADE